MNYVEQLLPKTKIRYFASAKGNWHTVYTEIAVKILNWNSVGLYCTDSKIGHYRPSMISYGMTLSDHCFSNILQNFSHSQPNSVQHNKCIFLLSTLICACCISENETKVWSTEQNSWEQDLRTRCEWKHVHLVTCKSFSCSNYHYDSSVNKEKGSYNA